MLPAVQRIAQPLTYRIKWQCSGAVGLPAVQALGAWAWWQSPAAAGRSGSSAAGRRSCGRALNKAWAGTAAAGATAQQVGYLAAPHRLSSVA